MFLKRGEISCEYPTVHEIKNATVKIVKYVQMQVFSKELKIIQSIHIHDKMLNTVISYSC